MDLNAPQREAVLCTSGPLLVLAGAGTGKTRVVTYRIAELIRRGTSPDRILAVTFTNKAAREMQERAAALLGRQLKPKPEISTFHSLCVRILRRNAQQLGYPAAFAIYDRGDQESIARGVLRDIRVAETALRPGDLLALVSNWKNACVRPDEAAARAETDREHYAAAGYRRYQRALKAAGAMDFDDLLLVTEELFRRFEDVRAREAGRFDHVLVDEYQDTNGSQYRIVKALADEHRNLCVVGDDDQSIYGWRGAEVTHILHFTRDWPDARVVRLEDNYRSTGEILDWANRLIACNKQRHGKVLRASQSGERPAIRQFDNAELEAQKVVEDIADRLRNYGRAPSQIAILFRTNEQPRLFETELRRLKIPYVLIGGQSFYDRKEVRDILAYLKVVSNPRDDVSLLRIINTPPRGLGQTTVTKILERAVAAEKPVWDELAEAAANKSVPNAAIEGIGRLREMIETCRRAARGTGLPDAVRQLIAASGYRKELARLYHSPEEQETRWTGVEDLVNAAAEYARREPAGSITGFIHEVALFGQEDDRDKEKELKKEAVALMTLHAAKGLEFSEVYMVGMEEGILPHQRSLDEDRRDVAEERRLCYVGVTRAQRRLTLSMALSRMKWGKARPTVPSRFLFELTGQAGSRNYQRAIAGKPPLAKKAEG